MSENLPNNTWAPPTCKSRTISQHHSLENHPMTFLLQRCSFFQKIHVMHTHLISRLPRCIGNALCHFNTIYITHANISSSIYLHNLNHNMLYKYITPKISSHGLINKHKQIYLNYSTKHIFSQNILPILFT